jgi:riboflavin synthase
LQEKRPGDEVNIETDIIGKYLERFLFVKDSSEGGGITFDLLAKNGFL